MIGGEKFREKKLIGWIIKQKRIRKKGDEDLFMK